MAISLADERVAPLYSRVEWAKTHIRDLKSYSDAFIKSDPYEVSTKPDPNTPNCIKYYIASIREQPPPRIALAAGDVLFNLRAALDHLAFQLVWVNGTRDEKTLRATYFPIFDNAKEYKAKAGRKIQGMAQDTKDAIDATKPYKGGNNVLWQLHTLNNIDKHRVLVTVGSPLSSHTLPAPLRQPIIDTIISTQKEFPPDWIAATNVKEAVENMTLRPPIRKCPLEVGDELELALSPIPETDEKMKITFEIAFCEPKVAESQPLVETLEEMANVVDNLILSFQPLLA